MVPPLADDLVAGAFPHLAGTEPGIAEAIDQRLDDGAIALGLPADTEARDDGLVEVEPLDALGGPIGGDIVAVHAPDLFGVGLEEDLEQAAAEVVDHPLLEADDVAIGAGLRPGIGQDAAQRLDRAELASASPARSG